MSVQTRLTAAEFVRLPETNTPTELIDGEIIVSPSPTLKHQIIARNLTALLLQMTLDGEVLFAPLDVHLDEYNVVQPDVLWLAPDTRCQVVNERLVGAPDLVIEIVSPSSSSRDRREKYHLYERFGVREYWLIDPAATFIEGFTLIEGRYQRFGLFVPGEMLTSPC